MRLNPNTPAENNRVCLIGYMAGARPGFITSQGLILARLLKEEGWSPTTVSRFHNRWLRMLETLWTLLWHGGKFPVAILEMYGGWGFYLADITSAAARLRNLPLIMVLHGGSIPDLVRARPAWVKRVLSRARVLIAPSRYLARTVEELPGLSPLVIPNVIPIHRYEFTKREKVRPRLLWMRSFHEVYNPTMALRVLKRLLERYSDAELIMAGRDDESCAMVRQEAVRAGVSGKVSFPGFLDIQGKIAAAGRTDIFINTNRIDNMPVAVVEACAFGLPVVATAIGGLPDLLTHEETGLLVPGDDDAAMADAIARLVDNPALACRLSVNGRNLAELSGAGRVVPQWTQLLRNVAERNGS